VIEALTIGTIIKGGNNVGFNTIGAPKIIGSFMLNIEGRIAAFQELYEMP